MNKSSKATETSPETETPARVRAREIAIEPLHVAITQDDIADEIETLGTHIGSQRDDY